MERHSKQRSHQRENTVLFVGTLAIVCVGIFIFLKPLFKNASLPSSMPSSVDNTEPTSATGEKELPFISVQDIWLALGQGKNLQFLDIRSQEAFEKSHIPYSKNVPEEKLSTYIPKEKDAYMIIVFSLDQAEALQKVHETLKQSNIPHFFITGGILALEKEHYPLISFGDPDSFSDRSKVTYFTAAEAKKYMDENTHTRFVFLDVRSTQEFAFAHVKDAKSIPLQAIEDQSSSLDRSTMFLIYGNTMLDAFQAAVRLSDLNFALVRAISDPPPDIEKAGIPIEKGTRH